MRILITNDDGINAAGLRTLEAIAAELAGPQGEVWTVAPAFEQSGVAHSISYVHPTLIAELGPRRFAAEGTPADCVLAAIADVMRDSPPDLVLSGVNRGNNSGENVMYSGTIGAAMEAALQGLPAIALSQYMGPRTAALDDPFQAARVHGPALIRRLLERGDWTSDQDFRLFYNINFPPCSADAVRGLRVAPQGRRQGVRFEAEPYHAPNGRRFLWVLGGSQTAPATPGSDVDANMNDYIALTPMRPDLTCHASLDGLRAALQEG
ncbi:MULTISPECIES: 5'/3'-nucleotidase SurE [unclassified Paracoccus (in: a-proteobacteria)]|uniref:5'/3'-nucleotidase SurE n=1 Tax=unclassified Paracoccus (in: a-proteobacteria) TaxID=2688777 RepID=UPI0012B2FB49|nr:MULTISPECIES: 5'/3'-nucleotidase SurE [unclassified Paracoccus (in: a-proteobacteria)]UXU75814.1 5'/3'-nucleotidase SurE [Paracoccus sp. SMMA_5]UXU81723.1 5'/3'-nucleotidase SurE [Paracoccus sp. SMMA_5_TC]